MASMALLVVLWTCSDWFVGRVVQGQVDAFERALAQASLRPEEFERGKRIAHELGEAIKTDRLKRDDNLDPWPQLEKILADFRADTDGGQKTLTPVQARTYIERMQEVLDDLNERKGGAPPRPQ